MVLRGPQYENYGGGPEKEKKKEKQHVCVCVSAGVCRLCPPDTFCLSDAWFGAETR